MTDACFNKPIITSFSYWLAHINILLKRQQQQRHPGFLRKRTFINMGEQQFHIVQSLSALLASAFLLHSKSLLQCRLFSFQDEPQCILNLPVIFNTKKKSPKLFKGSFLYSPVHSSLTACHKLETPKRAKSIKYSEPWFVTWTHATVPLVNLFYPSSRTVTLLCPPNETGSARRADAETSNLAEFGPWGPWVGPESHLPKQKKSSHGFITHSFNPHSVAPQAEKNLEKPPKCNWYCEKTKFLIPFLLITLFHVVYSMN